jgi:hypothetical protein
MIDARKLKVAEAACAAYRDAAKSTDFSRSKTP